MRLVAIFLKDHFLYNKPQSINFGGKFTYTFNDIKGEFERTENKKFIENFYLSETITLLSAVVGKNGAGKTSLLTSVIDIIHDRYSFDYIAFFENNQDTFYKANGISVNTTFKVKALRDRLETIYYSPFLDYKNQYRGIDLSFDAIIEKDLEDINDVFHANDIVNPNRRLQTKNWFRQIEFQDSIYGQSLKEFFDFPDYNQNRISFTRHKLDLDNSKKINFWNTPNNFRQALQIIYNKIEDEASEIRPNREDIIVLQKELFKNYILLDFLSLFIVQMEKSNDYLQEGIYETDNKNIKSKLLDLNAKDSIIYFLDNHYFKVGGKKIKILPVKETKDFIEALFDIINKIEAKSDNDTRYFDWGRKALYLEKEDTKNIIVLQNKFLNIIDRYYGSEKDDEGNRIFNRADRVSEIVNFEPSDRKLSSGENALLNLYSRIYDFFNKNIIRLPKRRRANFYYLLLDEADLGFHPQWKKLFVKSILKFAELFFNNLNSKVQIIFTTHDPLTLSDILNTNIVYVNKSDNIFYILNDELSEKPKKSFAANITDLLADSFFIDDGLIGDFAKDKIKETIQWLENHEDKTESIYFSRIIESIDEPIIQRKLAEMYDDKMKSTITIELIDKQIQELEILKKQFKDDSHRAK